MKSRGGDEQDEFPLQARPGEARAHVAGGPTRKVSWSLVTSFATQITRASPEGRHQVVDRLGDPVAALVEGDRVFESRGTARRRRARAAGLGGEEADEEEAVRRQAAGAQDGGEGARARAPGRPAGRGGGRRAPGGSPGSLSPGVPASLTRATEAPAARRSTRRSAASSLIVLVVGDEFAAQAEAGEQAPSSACPRRRPGRPRPGWRARARSDRPGCRSGWPPHKGGPGCGTSEAVSRPPRPLECAVLPPSPCPGIWFSQFAGWLQGMEESWGACVGQPARSRPRASKSKPTTVFRKVFMGGGTNN